MNNQSLPVHERGQSKISQRLEAELGEMTLLVPSENMAESISMVAISVRVCGESVMESLVQDAVKQKVNDAFFPRRDVEGSALSVEIVRESDGRSELEDPRCSAP
jgi:hypothetical protein